MGTPILVKTTFPAANTQDVGDFQSTVGAANLHIDGFLASNGSVSFISLGYARQISFVSTGSDLSTATFTVYGTQNAVSISENVTGPAANLTTYSSLVYDTITMITVNSAVVGVCIGTGYNGFFNLINVDQTANNSNYAFSLGAKLGTNQIQTTVYSTLDNISNNGSTFSNIISTNVGTLQQVKAISATSLYTYPVSPANTVPLVNQILIQLTGSTSTLSNSTTLIYRQTT